MNPRIVLRLTRGLRAFGALLLPATLALATPTAALAQGDLDAPARQRLAYQVRPATVMIAWQIDAEIEVPGTEGPVVLKTQDGGMGSGWILTPDGFLVTNGHVVANYYRVGEDQIKRGLLAKALIEGGYFDQRAAAEGRNLTAAEIEKEIDNLYDVATVAAGGELKVALQNGDIYVADIHRFSGPINTYTGNLSVGDRFTAQSGQDVAILKIPARDLPTLRLGDQETVRVGEQVFVSGFPGAVVSNAVLGPENVLEASVIPGQITGVRGSVQGADLLQLDATIAHGNSGGPVVDGAGAVLGIATLGNADVQAAAGFNFAVPASTIRNFIGDINTSESMFNRTWKTALDYYYAGSNNDAVGAFDEVLRVMPNLPDALSLRREAMINRGDDVASLPPANTDVASATQPAPTAPAGMPSWLLPVLALGVLLVGAGLVMRRSPAPATAGGSNGARSAASSAATIVAPAPTVAGGVLIATDGLLKGNRFDIESGGLKIGRDPAVCQIVLSEGSVSREHAVIRPNGGNWSIKNLSGTNPTYVNDRAIQETTLKKGDKVKVGESTFVLEGA